MLILLLLREQGATWGPALHRRKQSFMAVTRLTQAMSSLEPSCEYEPVLEHYLRPSVQTSSGRVPWSHTPTVYYHKQTCSLWQIEICPSGWLLVKRHRHNELLTVYCQTQSCLSLSQHPLRGPALENRNIIGKPNVLLASSLLRQPMAMHMKPSLKKWRKGIKGYQAKREA